MDPLDLAAKALLADDPIGFARLLLGRRARIRWARAEDVEVRALARRVDKVLRVKLVGERRSVRLHFEVVAGWRSNVPRRTYEYQVLLERAGDPVESLVLCLKRGRRQADPVGRYVRRGRTNTLIFRFPVLCLWKLTARRIRALGEVFLPFLPFARDATIALVEEAQRELASVEPAERCADLQGALALIASNVFKGVDWLSRVPLEVLLKNSFVEGVKKLGATDVVATQLRTRLGTAAARPYVKRLPSCTTRTLNRLVKLLGTTANGDELTAALDRLLPAD